MGRERDEEGRFESEGRGWSSYESDRGGNRSSASWDRDRDEDYEGRGRSSRSTSGYGSREYGGYDMDEERGFGGGEYERSGRNRGEDSWRYDRE